MSLSRSDQSNVNGIIPPIFYISFRAVRTLHRILQGNSSAELYLTTTTLSSPVFGSYQTTLLPCCCSYQANLYTVLPYV